MKPVWHTIEPVDDRERERARRIEAIQGNQNPFIWGETQPAMPRLLIWLHLRAALSLAIGAARCIIVLAVHTMRR